MLTIEQLEIAYKDFDLKVEKLHFKPGINVILGPNGSGKSSLLKGLIGYGGNDIKRREISFSERPLFGVESTISYLPQESPRLRIRVSDYIRMTSKRGSTERFRAAVDDFGLEGMLEQSIETLSGGEFKRVQCAQVHMEDKPVLVVDEIEQGLDLRHQHEVMSWLAQEGDTRCVIANMHDVALALSYADSVVLLKDGRAEGPVSPEDITGKRLSEHYGIPLTIERREGAALVYHEPS